MSQLILIEGKGEQAEHVKQMARNHNFEIREENQNLCIIQHRTDNSIVAILGFRSDAGTDYHTKGETEISLEHEKIYMEDKSFVSKDDLTILDGLADLIAGWMYRYLLSSAVTSARPIGERKSVQVFEHYISNDVDNIMYWSMKRFNNQMFAETLDILGYKNKLFIETK